MSKRKKNYLISNKNNKIKIGTLTLLLVITVGLAYLFANLKINGITNIGSFEWDVHFENANSTDNCTVYPEEEPFAPAQSKLQSISYDLTFTEMGQVYEFTVDVKNDGTLDAVIENIRSKIKVGTNKEVTIKSDKSNIPDFLIYSVSYDNDDPIISNHLLESGDYETIKVHVELKDNLTSAQLEEAKNNPVTLGLDIDYAQKDIKDLELDYYVVNLETFGGEINPEKVNVVKGETLSNIPTPTKEGYYFDDWYLEDTYETKIPSNFVPTKNMDIYANWIPSVGSLKLAKNFRVNVNSTTPIEFENLDDVDETFTFTSLDESIATIDENGVITGLDEGEARIQLLGNTSGQIKTITVPIEFEKYEVLFNGNGGNSDLSKKRVRIGEAIGELPYVEHPNYDYSLVGWFTETTPEVQVTEEFVPTKDMEIYAKWVNTAADPLSCTYTGELTQGAEFTDGQYIYKYMQEGTGSEQWKDITTDGWGVMVADKNSDAPITTQLCQTINDKPIVSMSYMFANSKASEFNTDSFDTSKVVNMQNMFQKSNFKNLDLRRFDTSNVTSMFRMFSESQIGTIDLTTFNTSKVTDMSDMFSNCPNLTEVNLSGFRGDSLLNVFYMFYGDNNLKYLNLTGFNVLNYQGSEAILDENSSDLEIIADNWVFDKYAPASEAFHYNLMENFSGYNVQYRLRGVKKLSAKNWVLPQESRGLMSINSLNFDFNVESTLEEVDVTGWDLSKTESLAYLFEGNPKLTTITGMETWNTSNITDMAFMFSKDTNLVNFDVSSFNTSNVAHMAYMFYQLSNITDIDISGFNSAKVEEATNMFSECTNLQTIYATNNFDLSELQYSDDDDYEYDNKFWPGGYTETKLGIMFKDSTHLVGGAGTYYSDYYVNNDYARLDDGETNYGYFSTREKLKITYDTNGGSLSTTVKYITYNTPIGTLPEPTKNGSIFKGWYTGLSSGTEVDSSYVPSGDITIYARWKEDTKYKVTFDPNGGELGITARKVSANSSIGTLPIPKNEGYVLEGWFTGLNSGIKVTSNYKVTNDITIYSKWTKTIKELTIPSHMNVIVGNNKTIEIGNTTEVEEYTFTSSNTDIATVNQSGEITGVAQGIVNIIITGKNSNITRNVTVYVLGNNTSEYTITFDASGGTVSEQTRKVYAGYSIGELPIPTKDNKSFAGWKDENNNYYTSNSKVSRNITLTAVWSDTEYVARIGNNHYTTLQSALDASYSDDTVVLLKDVKESVSSTNNITLDLDHNTLRGSIDFTASITVINGRIENNDLHLLYGHSYADLTLGGTNQKEDSYVEIVSTATDNEARKSGMIVTTYSTLTINNARIEDKYIYEMNSAIHATCSTVVINNGVIDSEERAIILDGMYGSLEMNGGTIKSNYAIDTDEGEVTINDGTIIGSVKVGAGDFTMNDGTITAYIGVYSSSYGTITMNGGTITATEMGLYLDDGPAYLNGGTINSKKYGIRQTNDGDITLNGVTINAKNSGIYANSSDGLISIKEGTTINVSTTSKNNRSVVGVDGNYITMDGGTINVEGPNEAIGIYNDGFNDYSTITLNGGTMKIRSTGSKAYGLYGMNLRLYGGTMKVKGKYNTSTYTYSMYVYYEGSRMYGSGKSLHTSTDSDGFKVYSIY